MKKIVGQEFYHKIQTIWPSKSRNLAGPSTENSFQSTRLLRGYKNLVKNKYPG